MPYNPKAKPAVHAERNGPARPIVQGVEAIRGARNLIRRFGAQVEPALYALLCDGNSATRAAVDKALKGGSASATEVLVPLLIGQYALAPAVAAVVAAVAVQAIASAGQEKLCEEFARTNVAAADARPDPHAAPAPARPKGASRRKAATAKRPTQKK